MKSRKIKAVSIIVVILVLIPLIVSRYAFSDITEPQSEILLDLSYGSGDNEVGKTCAGEIDASSPAECPAMFQMTPDGAIWILDTVNSRVVKYENSKQVKAISTEVIQKWSAVFGISADTLWIKAIADKENQKWGLVSLNIDNFKQNNIVLKLSDISYLDPLKITPLNTIQSQIIAYGTAVSTDGKNSTESMILNHEGEIISRYADKNVFAGMDGSIWSFEITNSKLRNEAPFVISKYNDEEGVWETTANGSLPRQSQLYEQKKSIISNVLGMDNKGNITIALYEGKPLSLRFIRISDKGEIQNIVNLSDIGLDQEIIGGKYFAPSEHYQLLPDGSILAKYATLERFKIVKITF